MTRQPMSDRPSASVGHGAATALVELARAALALVGLVGYSALLFLLVD